MKKIIFLWLVCLFIYLFFSAKLDWRTTSKNYFSLQAYSFLHGHLDLLIKPKDLQDISIYQNRAFLYWPPLPALFVLPFVFFFGVEVSDIFYTAFWASFGPVLLYILLKKARDCKMIPAISEDYILLLTIFFAFGTVYFYLSVLGTVWFTSQVISLLPYLISLIFLFEYIQKGNTNFFYSSILFLCFAFWGRNTLVLSFPIYLLAVFISKGSHQLRLISFAVLLLLLNFILFGLFNYYRFGSFFENGLNYQKFNQRYFDHVSKYGLFSSHYLMNNIYYLFFNPLRFTNLFPYISPDPEGNSLFFTSPLFLLIFGIIDKRLFNRKSLPVWMYLMTIIIILIPILFYYGTGWFQFGYRYCLDFLVLFILSLAWVINHYPKSFVLLLFVLSVMINSLGVCWMMMLAPVLYF